MVSHRVIQSSPISQPLIGSPGLIHPSPYRPKRPQNDARFRRIAEAWPALSDAQRARITAIVEGTGGDA